MRELEHTHCPKEREDLKEMQTNKTAMVIEMARDLAAMEPHMYMTCKYILLISSMNRRGVHDLVRALVDFADTHRLLVIEMKKDGGGVA